MIESLSWASNIFLSPTFISNFFSRRNEISRKSIDSAPRSLLILAVGTTSSSSTPRQSTKTSFTPLEISSRFHFEAIAVTIVLLWLFQNHNTTSRLLIQDSHFIYSLRSEERRVG